MNKESLLGEIFFSFQIFVVVISCTWSSYFAQAFFSCLEEGLLFLQFMGSSFRGLLSLQSTDSRVHGLSGCGFQP